MTWIPALFISAADISFEVSEMSECAVNIHCPAPALKPERQMQMFCRIITMSMILQSTSNKPTVVIWRLGLQRHIFLVSRPFMVEGIDVFCSLIPSNLQFVQVLFIGGAGDCHGLPNFNNYRPTIYHPFDYSWRDGHSFTQDIVYILFLFTFYFFVSISFIDRLYNSKFCSLNIIFSS